MSTVLSVEPYWRIAAAPPITTTLPTSGRFLSISTKNRSNSRRLNLGRAKTHRRACSLPEVRTEALGRHVHQEVPSARRRRRVQLREIAFEGLEPAVEGKEVLQ